MSDLKLIGRVTIGDCPPNMEKSIIFPETDFTQTTNACGDIILTPGGTTGAGFSRSQKVLTAGDVTAINFGGAGLNLGTLTFDSHIGDAYSAAKILAMVFKNGQLVATDEYTIVAGVITSTGVISDWSEGDLITVVQF